MATGVYVIRNKINTKIYVGSAAGSFGERFFNHKSALQRGVHCNKHLQAAWNKYGADTFEFVIIEECKPEDCITLEQYYIDFYDTSNPSNGYNKCPIAGSSLGTKHTDEVKAKMSELRKGKAPSAECIAKAAEMSRGKKRPPEVGVKISLARKGNKLTDEHKAALKAAWKRTPEQLAKMAESKMGKKQSQETIAKRSASLIGNKNATRKH